MANINLEFLNAPIDTELYHAKAQQEKLAGRSPLVLGVAVAVLDASNRILVLHHEAREGEYAQGALGPSMEKFRYVPRRGRFIAESPIEVWQRSLHEELAMDTDSITRAGLYIARDSFMKEGEWRYPLMGTNGSVFSMAISLCVRVENPDVIVEGFKETNEEVIGVSFEQIKDVKTEKNVRQGFHEWLDDMFPGGQLPSNPLPLIYIEPVLLPKKDFDVRFDG